MESNKEYYVDENGERQYFEFSGESLEREKNVYTNTVVDMAKRLIENAKQIKDNGLKDQYVNNIKKIGEYLTELELLQGHEYTEDFGMNGIDSYSVDDGKPMKM